MQADVKEPPIKRLLYISALTLVTIGLLAPADFKMTQGEPNGRFWHGANADWKVGYVMGYTAAYTSYLDIYRAAYGAKPRYEPIWFRGHPLYNEVVDGVTDVYKDAANAVFPVSTAISIVALKFNGESQQRIESFMETSRKVYAGSSH